MNTTDSVEVSAATVDEAVKEGLARLGASEGQVSIEVLAAPRAGVLGLGARQARVRITHRPLPGASSGVTSPPPAPPSAARPAGAGRTSPEAESRDYRGSSRSEAGPLKPLPPTRRPAPAVAPERPAELPPKTAGEPPATVPAASADASTEVTSAADAMRRSAPVAEQVSEAIGILRKILEMMGEKASVSRNEKRTDAVELEIKGDGSGILIGRRGQTLEALEHLLNRILARRIRDVAPIVLDAESYRARRRQQLERMALSMGERAKREHRSVKLEPMSARDRRMIHLALKDDPMVTTRSTGDGLLRSVEIVPADAKPARPRQARQPKVEPKPQEAIGEQGGFRHGQKKII